MQPTVDTATMDVAPSDANGALWARAQAVLPAALSGRLASALADRHFCVLTDDPATPEAQLFARAAASLGAYVTYLSPTHAGLGGAPAIEGTGRVLARLYDAIECQGMAAQRAQELAASTGVPVFAGLALAARGWGGKAVPLLQACLVASVQ